MAIDVNSESNNSECFAISGKNILRFVLTIIYDLPRGLKRVIDSHPNCKDQFIVFGGFVT
ncbi:MAG: hypothetical protein WD757_03140 [Actinomycetota bacterium]